MSEIRQKFDGYAKDYDEWFMENDYTGPDTTVTLRGPRLLCRRTTSGRRRAAVIMTATS